MGRPIGNGRITTSVTVSPEFFRLTKEHGLSFTEALRTGLAIKFAELGIAEYDNELNLFKKMTFFKQKMEENSEKLIKMEEKMEKMGKNTLISSGKNTVFEEKTQNAQ
jgi:hypothetical protein